MTDGQVFMLTLAAVTAVVTAVGVAFFGLVGWGRDRLADRRRAALDLDHLHLDKGSHPDRSNGLCVMEAVAWFAGEPHTDQPQCVAPYLRQFGITLNDRANDQQRQDLRRFVPLVVGTAGDGLDEKRRWLAADHVTRVATPKWLDAAGLTGHAATLRALPPITDVESYLSSREAVRAARDAAYQLRAEKLGGSLYDYMYGRVKAAVREALSKQQRAAAATDAATAAADAAIAAAATAADATADATAAATDAATTAAAAATAAATDAATTAATAAATDAATTAADAADAAADAADAAIDAATADFTPVYGAEAYRAWRSELRDTVYTKVRAIYEERFADLVSDSWADAVGLYERLITCEETA